MQKYVDLVLQKFFSLEAIWVFVGSALLFPLVFMIYSFASNPPAEIRMPDIWPFIKGLSFMLIISFTMLIYQAPVFLVYCSVDLYLKIKNIPTAIRFVVLLLVVIAVRVLIGEWLGTNGIFHYDRFWGAPMGMLQLVSMAIIMAALTIGPVRRKLGL